MTRNVTEHRPIKLVVSEILPQLYISTMFEEFLNAKKVEGINDTTLEIFHRDLQKFKRLLRQYFTKECYSC